MRDYKDLRVGSKLGIKSKDHWQVNVELSPKGENDDPAKSFLPTPGKNRAQPHKKINECDH
jgi:hypothetical protein